MLVAQRCYVSINLFLASLTCRNWVHGEEESCVNYFVLCNYLAVLYNIAVAEWQNVILTIKCPDRTASEEEIQEGDPIG